MRPSFKVLVCVLFFSAWPLFAQDPGTQPRIRYSLLDESFFVDECLICGRPTILEPMRGTFDLVLLQDTPPVTQYAILGVNFFTQLPWQARKISGSGAYVRFEEFARLQNLTLDTDVSTATTNRRAFFTNGTPVAIQPFPIIQASLEETNGTLVQTYSMEIKAAPVRELWFSTAHSFVSTNGGGTSNQISAGDLLSSSGRIVRANQDLMRRLGLMPSMADHGLDAVQIQRGGEILFSLPVAAYSETLGVIQHGDILSDQGSIFRRNQELLAAFKNNSSADLGLDAFQIMPDGEILFSTRSNLSSGTATPLRGSDILSDRGFVFATQAQLLANFRPAQSDQDPGLDAFHVLPWGEIWFSVEKPFVDSALGTINAGDLLSNAGYRVFRNSSLLAGFLPAEPAADSGLDAVFVITDIQPLKSPPRLLSYTRSAGASLLTWQGEGAVFQVEHSSTPNGPWEPCSQIIPDVSLSLTGDLVNNPTGFFRVRQW